MLSIQPRRLLMIARQRQVKVKHIQQRTDCDCVIATAAVVSNLPYAEAARISPVKPGRRGLFPNETRCLLRKTTGVRWYGPRFAWFRNLARLASAPTIRVVAIRRPWTLKDLFTPNRRWHCIATRNGFIYDPEFDRPLRSSAYARIGWTVVGYYKPANHGKLETAQLLNAKKFGKTRRLWSDLLEWAVADAR